MRLSPGDEIESQSAKLMPTVLHISQYIAIAVMIAIVGFLVWIMQ
jgi:hypothetical protein